MDYVDTQSVKEGNTFAFEPHPYQIRFDYVHLTSLSDLWFRASPPDVIYIGLPLLPSFFPSLFRGHSQICFSWFQDRTWKWPGNETSSQWQHKLNRLGTESYLLLAKLM